MIRWIAALVLMPVVASAQESFQLPSGNIHCAVFDGVLRCDILQAAYRRPPPPPDCEQDFGDAVELGPAGPARLLCHGDTVAEPRAPVLGYGRAWQGPSMSCTASASGLRCVNAAGHGFDMARSRLSLF